MKRASLPALLTVAGFAVFSAGCAKKVAVATPPRPSPSAAPAPAPRTPAPAATTASRQPERSAPVSSRYPDAATRKRIDELLARIEDAYFDYNQAALRPDAMKALEADSTELRDILKNFPEYKLTIEGHCDERGSAEYNIALGDKRAEAAKAYLTGVGIPGGQLDVVSYGKDRPVCQDHDEACWQRNRRIHIVAQAQKQG